MKPPLEKVIQLAICDYLTYRKHFFYRNNNTPVFDTTRQAFRAMPKHTPKGLPDVVVIFKGQYIGLEVKRPGGKQSPEQKDIETRVKAAGGNYAVVYSIDDVKAMGL